MNFKYFFQFFCLLSLFACWQTSALAQTRAVSGTVVDDSTQSPIAGVTIKVKGGPQTAVTNSEGAFTLNLPVTGALLQYSHVSFTPGEMQVSADAPIRIEMRRLPSNLDEVVVVGYGTQRKSHLTAAIETIKAAEVQDLPTGSLGTALAGRVLGLSVTGGIARPGTQPSLRLRNPESISKDGGNTTPLIVIDGVIQTNGRSLNDATLFNSLDPTEVESISFLKDAAAAIYGSRGANGVIIVTTKRGVSGKPRITYSGSYGWNEEAYRTKMMSAYELGRYINIANGPNGANIADPEDRTRFFSADELEHFKTVDHDWLEKAWYKSYNTRHTVNLSGGADKATYFASLSYFNQNGNLGSMDYGRWNYRAGTDATVATGLKVGLQVAGVLGNNRKVFSKIGNENIENDYRNLLRAPRYVPTYIDGRPVKLPGSTSANNISGYHFFEIDKTGNYTDEEQSVNNVNLYAEYEPGFLKGLKLRGSYARNTDFNKSQRLGTRYRLYRFDLVGDRQHIYEGATVKDSAMYENGNEVRFSTIRNKLVQANFIMTYAKKIGKHDISALFSAERSETETTQEDVSREQPYNGSNGQLLSGASGVIDGRSFKYEGGNLGYIGKLNYAYDSKYLAEFLYRTDASTKFAPENYWGNFYSLSGGWVISRENFFKSQKVNFLKLRYSVGISGADDIALWQWRQRYTFQNGQGGVFGPGNPAAGVGMKMETSPNRNASWSNDFKQNIGIDARFFNNRLSTTIEGFYNNVTDILVNRVSSVPVTVGGSAAPENYAKVNYFGLEMALAWDDNIGEDFSYGISTRWSWYENKNILNDYNAQDIMYPWNARQGMSGDIGQWGYDYMGMFRSQADIDTYVNQYGIKSVFGIAAADLKPGSLYYRDVRGPLQADGTFAGPDGIIDNNDQIQLARKASNHWGLGSTIRFGYKGINLESVITASWGGWSEMDARELLERNIDNLYQSGVSYWADIYDPELNPGGKYPNPFFNTINLTPRSNFWKVSAFRMRMRNINLNYAIPKRLVEKAHMNSARIVFTVLNPINFYNPFTYRDADNGWDTYPILRTYSIGLNLSF